MCGSDGQRLARVAQVDALVEAGRRSSSALTNWLDALASIVTSPPGTPPAPSDRERQAVAPVVVDRRRRGSPARSSTAPIGRTRARGSPSKRMSPLARPATTGRNRMTVPASPQSTCAGPFSVPGSTRHPSPLDEISAPIDPQAGHHQLRVAGLEGSA